MEPPKLSQLADLFKNVVTAIMALAGIVLFVMLFMGGLKYITSGGDPKGIEGAQKTISYAIYGLLAILVSYLILYIIGQVTGATNITKFSITI